MENKIHHAFDQICAEEALKEKTKAAVADALRQQTESQGCQTAASPVIEASRRPGWLGQYRGLVTAAVCLLLVLTGCGAWTGYHAPAVTISVDINPSLEMDINRFDRVVAVTGYNEDGQQLAEVLDIKYCKYEEAMSRLLEQEQVAELLAEDGVLTIAVSGRNESQCQRVQSSVQLCVGDQQNAYCYRADPEEAAQAHHLGMTCGRYRLYQLLLSYCPEMTPEEIRQMTMRQLYDRLEKELAEIKENYGELSEEMEDLFSQIGRHHGKGGENGSGNGNGHHGGRRE